MPPSPACFQIGNHYSAEMEQFSFENSFLISPPQPPPPVLTCKFQKCCATWLEYFPQLRVMISLYVDMVAVGEMDFSNPREVGADEMRG